MVTQCHKCGRKIEDVNESGSTNDFLLCKYCNAFTPRGSNTYKLKGGKIMEKKEKAPKITFVRKQNTMKVIELLNREVPDVKEQRKVLSNAYGLLKGK